MQCILKKMIASKQRNSKIIYCIMETSNMDRESSLLNAPTCIFVYTELKSRYGILHLGLLVSFALLNVAEKCWSSQPDVLIYICCCYDAVCISQPSHISFPAYSVFCVLPSVTMSSVRRSKAMPTDGPTAKFLYTILKQLDLKSVSPFPPQRDIRP